MLMKNFATAHLLHKHLCSRIWPKRYIHCASGLWSRWAKNDAFLDPLKELQPFLQVPLIKEDDYVFKPSQDELEKAQELFREHKGYEVQASKGVVNLDYLPEARLPEVAFVGRSNVGKSSLIDALLYNPESVRISISKKPGHTRVLKFYTIHKQFSLVDMPGYGYSMPKYYESSMEQYMQTRQTLSRVFLLIDGKTGITPADQIGIDMLEGLGKPYVMVLTKVDRASHHLVLKNLLQIMTYREKHMHSCLPQPFLVSAHQNAGLAQLRAFIAYVTGNITISGL